MRSPSSWLFQCSFSVRRLGDSFLTVREKWQTSQCHRQAETLHLASREPGKWPAICQMQQMHEMPLRVLQLGAHPDLRTLSSAATVHIHIYKPASGLAIANRKSPA